MSDFFSLLTTIGQAELANAVALEQIVTLTQMAVGDGNGAAVTPTEAMTSLVNEVYRAGINSLSVVDAATMQAEVVIPTSIGGFYVREVGLFDADGQLFAVANLPDTYKPALTEGAGRELTVRLLLEITDSASVTLKVDPTVVLASRQHVADAVETHNSDTGAHAALLGDYAPKSHTHLAAQVTDLLTTPRSYTAVQAYTPATVEISDGAATWDLTSGAVAELAVAAADVTLALTNGVPGTSPVLRITHTVADGGAVIWPAAIKWTNGKAPDLSTAAGAVDLVQLDVGTGGTLYGQAVTGFAEVS